MNVKHRIRGKTKMSRDSEGAVGILEFFNPDICRFKGLIKKRYIYLRELNTHIL